MWLPSITTSDIPKVVWIYCLGQAGVHSKERADSLASSPPITGILKMHRMEIIINYCLLGDDTVVEETAWLRLQGWGIECGMSFSDCREGTGPVFGKSVCDWENQHPHASTSAGEDWEPMGLSQLPQCWFWITITFVTDYYWSWFWITITFIVCVTCLMVSVGCVMVCVMVSVACVIVCVACVMVCVACAMVCVALCWSVWLVWWSVWLVCWSAWLVWWFV